MPSNVLHGGNGANRPRFYTGWRRTLKRLPLAVRAWHYWTHPSAYPNFMLRPSRSGLVRSLQVEKRLGLTKLVEFKGYFFSSLTIPRFPSAAYDVAAARGGLNVMAAGTPAKDYVDHVILGISRQCTYDCRHCYEQRNLSDKGAVPVSRWITAISELQDIGVGIVILSGGEPMLRYQDVLAILEAADKSRSDFHLHTSGHGVTVERARRLCEGGLVAAAVALDDIDPDRFDDIRGSSGAFSRAVEALQAFSQAGIFTYANVCLSKRLVRSGDLWKLFDVLHNLGVGMVQLLEPRPCGGFSGKSMDELFEEADKRAVEDFVHLGNSERRFAGHPALYYVAQMEHPSRMGCMMGGLSHFTIDSAGNVNPCVFVPVSFGNILTDDVRAVFTRMREAIPAPIRRPCPSLLLADALHSYQREHPGGTIAYEEIRDAWRAELSGEPEPEVRLL